MAVLSIDGKEPEEKEKLNKSASSLEILFFLKNQVLFGILKEPLALLMLRENVCRLDKYGIIALMF